MNKTCLECRYVEPVGTSIHCTCDFTCEIHKGKFDPAKHFCGDFRPRDNSRSCYECQYIQSGLMGKKKCSQNGRRVFPHDKACDYFTKKSFY